MANIDSSDASTADIRTVGRVGQICGLFGPRVLELSAAEVAERLGLNRTTAYRYCTSMAAAGILEKGSRRGTFALGPLMLELGTLALGRKRVVEVARPYLRKLSAFVRMTAVLSIRGVQGPVVTLVEEDTSQPVVVTVHPGTRLDISAAQTRVFLAFSDMTIEQVEPSISATDRVLLESDLKEVRKLGFSYVRQGNGSFVVAVPVFDDAGMCATVAVLGAGEMHDLAP